MIPVTLEQIEAFIKPRSGTVRMADNYRTAFKAVDIVLNEFEINHSRLRLAHFFAQVGHECGLFTILRENMNYVKPSRIMEIFGVGNHSANIKRDESQALVKQPQALAERVYGLGNPVKSKELGNLFPGDGYKFRGNGMLQTTGRAAHKKLGELINVDLCTTPEAVTDPAYALRIAAAEFFHSNCLKFADADDLRSVTRRVNGAFNGFAERQQLLAKAKQVWMP